MSNKIMLEIARESKTKGNAKLVLLMIASYTHPDGSHCQASLSTLAKGAGISRRQVTTIVHTLASDGHITRLSGATERRSNSYTVLRPWLDKGNDCTREAIALEQSLPYSNDCTREISALGNTLPTNVEPKERKEQSCAMVALGKPLPYPEAPPSPPVAVCQEATNLLNSYGLSPHFLQVCQGKGPDAVPAEPPVLTSINTPTEPLEDIPTDPPPTPRPRTPRNPAAYRLGKLCPQGHDHESTGLSLRRMPGGSCVACETLRQRERDLAKNPNPRAHKPYAWKTQMESERVIFQPGEAPQRHREYRPNKARNGVAIPEPVG